MTEKEKIEYWYVFDRFRKSRESKYISPILKVLNDQKSQFIEQYKQGNITILDSSGMVDVLRKLHFDSGITWGAKVAASLKRIKGRMNIGFSERMQMLFEQYFGMDWLNTSEGITNTTKDILMQVIIEGNRAGLSFFEIVNQLEQQPMTRARARLISRTETIAAANYGAMAASEDSGLVLQKVWISAKDDRTRRDHYTVNPEPIEKDEPFIVGGYEMMQPGDKGGKDGRLKVPAKEVCNCRCAVAFVPVRDKYGSLL